MSLATNYDLGEEQIHDVLSNERRRHTLEVLKRERSSVDLRTLAERIAEAETGESPAPKSVRHSIYNSLHQTHLPKLDELGIVDYDKNRKTIGLREEAKTVDLYMEVLTPYGITWSTYYRSLSVLVLITVIADDVDALFLPGDYPVLIASIGLVLIALSTAYQLWSNEWIQIRGSLGD